VPRNVPIYGGIRMASKLTGTAAFFDVVRALEKERGSRIWCVVHVSHIGHICLPTMRSVLESRDGVGTGEIVEILIHSGGGHPDIAYRVMKFLRGRFKRVNVIVPVSAKSAATIMCLGADKVYLGELADLGPIDIQINDPVEHGDDSFSPLDEFKSLEFLREQATEWMHYYATVMSRMYGMSIKDALKDAVPLVTALMQPILSQIDPIEMGGYRRAIAIGEEYARRMLALTRNPHAEDIIEKTVWGYPSHDFCIDYGEALELGLPVEHLDRNQDRRLVAALQEMERDYHGFVPAPPSATTSTKPTRQRSRAIPAGRKTKGPVRGNGAGTRVRHPTPANVIQSPERPIARRSRHRATRRRS
jgi:hypothetical protein